MAELVLRYRVAVHVALALAGTLAGCAARTEFADPRSIVIEDPLPGQALVYFIRAPHDPLRVTVRVGERVVAVLPRESYSAVSLRPGEHRVQTVAGEEQSGGAPAAPEVTVVLAKDARYFLVLSGRSERPSAAVQALSAVAGGPFAWFVPMSTGVVPGSRTWKPYPEEEARPMLTIATLAPRAQ